MPHPIKVLLVEDSPVALAILKKLLSSSPEVTVAGTASNGKEALEAIAKLQPQVICTDLHMKEMDGLELTKQVMTKYPRPILVISASVQKENTQRIFELLQAGALDIFPKPTTGLPSDYEKVKLDLITKIKVLSGVKVFTKLPPAPAGNTDRLISELPPSIIEPSFTGTADIKIVAIGASTGGPQALSKILSQLPSNFPVPILCTQHISVGFLQGLVDWLGSECKLKVKIAQIGELPSAGTVYFAPEVRHLELSPQGRFMGSTSERVDGHCPSATMMFKSTLKVYGKATAGILLTGMGKDGAAGLHAIAQAGGTTIAQDEKSCVVFGMPKEAIALGAAQDILPIQEIAPLLLKKV
jgi:two-component system chemotaxis response regulator CheB